MNDIKQLGKRLQKHLTQTIEGIPAELGKRESGGSYTVPTGRPNEVYARLYGDDNQLITAINVQTKIQARLPVLVQLTTGGRYRVVSTDPAKIGQFLGANAPGASIPPVRGANVDAIWESYQFQPGRVHALNGSDLQVKMEPLPYFDTDLETTGNMATVVSTITSGKKAWIGIAVDPATNTLSFTKGTEYPLTIPLTRAMALAVTVPSGEIPLWAYPMRAGDTYVPVQKRSPDSLYFVDRRPWLQPQASANVTLPNFGAGVIKTLASGVASAGSDRHLIIAAESGAADDLIEITGLSVGDEVIIRADAGDTITVKDNDAGATDKILLYSGADIALSGNKTLKLTKAESGKVVQYVDEKGTGGAGSITVQLNYDETTDASPAASLTAATWTDLISNQSFDVDSNDSLIEVLIRAMALITNNGDVIASRIMIDSAGTPITRSVGGSWTLNGQYATPFAGSMPIIFEPGELSAGTHTIKVQIYAAQTANYYFLPTSSPDAYHCNVTVLEHIQV